MRPARGQCRPVAHSPAAVVYCRVSTEEQTRNLSLSTQREACTKYCQTHGLEVMRIFTEAGESAKTIDRPELQRMLTFCREHRDRLDFVIVYSLSRLARDTEGHFTIRIFLRKMGIGLRSVTEVIDETSQGRFTENVLAAVAQFDNDVRSERTIAGMRAALSRGRWTFAPPLGYLMGDPRTGPSLVLDPHRAKPITAAFEQIAAGEPRTTVLRRLNAQGLRGRNGRRLTPQTFGAMLRNPVYAGRIHVKKMGVDVAGDFNALVAKGLFERVQTMIRLARIVTKPHMKQHPDFPLRGFVRCTQCNRPLTASWSRGRSSRYAYYRCHNCGTVNCKRQELEQRFVELLRRLRLRPEFTRVLRETVIEGYEQRLAQARGAHKRLAERLNSP